MKRIFTIVSIVLMSCSPKINPSYAPLQGAGSFDLQGHRGCRGLMPENTVPAFLTAIDMMVTTLEMDVVISKDKKVVLSHDNYFSHEITTKPNGDTVTETEEKLLNIYQMTYEEVKKYDVGLKLHPRFLEQQKIKTFKPLLSDLVDSNVQHMMTMKRPPIRYNIETKCTPEGDGIYHPGPAEFVELLMAVIKEKDIAIWTTIQSFDIRTLQYLHEHYPDMQTALLLEDKKSFALQLKDLGFIPTIYSPDYTLATPLLVKQCHDAGIQIIPWTVNDKAEMTRLKNLGVDGIISDYPNLYYEP
ncbi:glycerophosphodiester phosphodiesterase family protein [soil metagenome]